MAKSPRAPEIDPALTYRVILARSVEIGRSRVHPGPNIRLRGDILLRLIAEDASAVTEYGAVASKAE